jgi:hypothetical protein
MILIFKYIDGEILHHFNPSVSPTTAFITLQSLHSELKYLQNRLLENSVQKVILLIRRRERMQLDLMS